MKAILMLARTEEGKRMRKAKKDQGMRYREGRCYQLRKDGCANTITGTPKDNLLVE